MAMELIPFNINERVSFISNSYEVISFYTGSFGCVEFIHISKAVFSHFLVLFRHSQHGFAVRASDEWPAPPLYPLHLFQRLSKIIFSLN